MSNRIAAPTAEPHRAHRPPTARAEALVGMPRRNAALVAGVGILLLAALAAFGNLVVVQGLVTDGNAAQTSRDIAGSAGTFGLGVVALYAVVALDVLVAWALLEVFRPVNQALSRLAAWFRITYAVAFLVAIAQLAGIPHLLSTRGSGVFSPGQVDAMALAKVDTFTDIYMAALVLFGAHLLLLGYLTYVTPQMPRLLGILLIVAGLGYVVDTVAAVLMTGSPIVVSTFTFLGEFLLAVWLVVRGRRLSQDPALGHNPPKVSS
jgi:Domain of unknown function (DUF4386)